VQDLGDRYINQAGCGKKLVKMLGELGKKGYPLL
jgi:hypothetical protein